MGTFAARRYRRRKVVWLITGHDAFATRLRQSAKPDETPLLVTKQLSRNGEFVDISIDVRCGEIVVITGLIGSGRTEPLETLFAQGARTPERYSWAAADVTQFRFEAQSAMELP